MRIDHVVYVVRDLGEAAERWRAGYGLASVVGGRHPRWGTANRIVPLGRDYLELISVVDPETAKGTALGAALLERADDGWFAVCVADDDIDATAARLDLSVDAGSRTRPDGAVVAWRGAGVEDPRRTAELPFFIAWDVPPELHPGAAAVAHPSGATGIASVQVHGDPARLRSWLGGADLPIGVTEGAPAVVAVSVRTRDGEVLVR
jgi:hypothetical protein